MLVEVLIFLVAVAVLFELVEHVVIPIAAVVAARKRQPATGAEGMVGKIGSVLDWSDAEGRVLVDGEIWKAESRDRLSSGDEAVVRAVRGLSLDVTAAQGERRA